MKIYVDILHAPKAGNAQSEYEDAFWPRGMHSTLQTHRVRIAAADGATDSFFSGLWARLLVRAYGRQRMDSKMLPEQLATLGRVWSRMVRRGPLPWYAEQKAEAGAHAAFVGLELTEAAESAGGTWRALACGDSCFFQLRLQTGKVVKAFPLSRSEEFSNGPVLLCSRGTSPEQVQGIVTAAGTWAEGDCFYLMTDALASWFLTNCEHGMDTLPVLRNLTLYKDPPFDDWISRLRERREIRNDDCTLVSVTFECIE
jgi:hypothetical protein